MEGGAGGGGGGASPGAARVKEEPEGAMFTLHMTIKEEVRLANEVLVKEEPECASSADCASGTGAGVCAGAAHVVKDGLELAPARVPYKPNILGVSRPLVSGGVTHRQPAGTTGAGHDTVHHNTINDTLQHTAGTHTYKCDTCGQIFQQNQCLIDHVQVHLREGSETLPNESLFIFEPHLKKYSCKICKKPFRKDYLKVHARFHTGEKPFACEVCNKQFAVLDSLRVHKRIHTEEKPYSCNICAKNFARRSGLKSHKLSHTGDKPFSCEICKRGFARPGTLKSHIRTHTGEKPYGCTVCKKRFTQWSALESHKRTHADANLYSRPLDCKYSATLHRCAVMTHGEPAGPKAAEHETVQQNTFTDSVQHTAETHTYMCDTCGNIFLQKQCLIDHVKVHLRERSDTLPNESLFILEPSDTAMSENKYSCKICKKTFRKNYLKIHARLHTGQKPYACEVCKKQFTVLGKLRDHKRIHSKEKPYSCDQCAKSFARSSYLKTHKLSHKGDKPYSCKICTKRFAQKCNLKAHERIHSRQKPYGCTICKKRFTQWRPLETHKRTHADAHPYSGEICKMTCMRLNAISAHKLNHTEEKGARGELYAHVTNDELVLGPGDTQRPKTDNVLGEKSRCLVRNYRPALDRCAVTAHRQPAETTGAEHDTVQQNTITDTLQHTAETHTYKCDTCGRMFLQKQCLIDHVKVHLHESSILDPSDTDTSVKKYSCKICKKKFRKNYLKIHERFHTGEKPYTCEVCKKQFATLGSLREHKRIHTEERPYFCDLCAKSFTRSTHLKIHERSHTGEKPYKCETCKKGFSQLPNLQSHIRTHTGEKPYVCTMCDKQFTQWSAFNNHKKTHTVESPYSCEISIKKFQQLGALNVHKISHIIHEAVSVKEKFECESSTGLCAASETHEKTCVKEEPKCGSSAHSCGVSETGASVDHMIKVELELGPEGVQQRDIPIAPRAASPRCELVASTSGASGARRPAPPPGTHTTHDTLQATTAGTHVMKQNHLTSDKQTTSKRPYTCDTCNKEFTQSGSLNTHKRIHTGEKPYLCEICNKKFTALATFNNHKITAHTQAKPYTCQICNKGFKQLRSLTSHGRIHSESKPFSCDICKRQFRYESALRVHKRIHTGVKPYSCPICKQHFRQNGGMKAHIIHIHTGEKPFNCDICKKHFATKGNLKYHIGTHAKDEY